MDTTITSTLIKAIVSEQHSIIGPMAIEQANKVKGVKISIDLTVVEVSGESEAILTDLVKQYEQIFGQASVEACKDAIKQILSSVPAADIPKFLL